MPLLQPGGDDSPGKPRIGGEGTSMRHSDLLRRPTLLKTDLDEHVYQCIRMLANAVDVLIRECVGLVSQQLAPMCNRDQIQPSVLEIAALHGSRAFRTSDPSSSVGIARSSAPTVEPARWGVVARMPALTDIDCRSCAPSGCSLSLQPTAPCVETLAADRSAVVLLEHEAKIRSTCIDAKRGGVVRHRRDTRRIRLVETAVKLKDPATRRMNAVRDHCRTRSVRAGNMLKHRRFGRPCALGGLVSASHTQHVLHPPRQRQPPPDVAAPLAAAAIRR